MKLLLQDGSESYGLPEPRAAERAHKPESAAWTAARGIMTAKLRPPETGGLIERPRLRQLLEESRRGFAGTLLSGRAGTGKSSLAALYAARRPGSAWLSVEPPDCDWRLFYGYFAAAVGSCAHFPASGAGGRTPSEAELAECLVDAFAEAPSAPSLIVLDDIHHIFDAPWFDGFFRVLLVTVPERTHVILTCRSRPSGPLWRMRSKQVLNVIDESLLAFSVAETAELFARLGLASRDAGEAQRRAFGRVSKLLAPG